MRKKYFLIAAALLAALSLASEGGILSALTPKDKTTTYKDIEELKGAGLNLMYARVNGVQIDIKDQSFACGLVLAPGKNFVKAEVWDKEGGWETYTRRILRLVSFPDVDALYSGRPHWAKSQIITLLALGIIEGYPDNNFYINKSLTRGELATWLCRAKGIKTSIPKEDVFADVPKEHWRAPYIKAIADEGLMSGGKGGYFGIDLPISRGETAIVALNAEGSAFEKEIVSAFFDVPRTNPYFEQIEDAKNKGLVKGIHWKKAIYEPDRDITRAEAAVLISRFNRAKWLKKWLYDWSEGYAKFCRVNTPPKITNIEIAPKTFSAGETPAVKISASAADLEGRESILNVKADISSFGGPPDAEMPAADGKYSLLFIATAESWGERTIKITATDKLGSKGEGQIKVLVVK